jgi:hypothetical protein
MTVLGELSIGPHVVARDRAQSRRLRLLRTSAVLVLAVIASVAASIVTAERDVAEPQGGPPTAAAPAAPAPVPEAEPVPVVRAVPLHIRVGDIRVDAGVVPVGLLDGGVMEIPHDVTTVGWYDPDGELGVAPGGRGTAVFAGHVDSRTQGRGALYFLRELAPGAFIELDMSDGSAQTWVVTETIQYEKVGLPYHEVFEWAGPPRLALITCGGEFDRTARSYTDNIVVYAVPSDAQPSAPPAA